MPSAVDGLWLPVLRRGRRRWPHPNGPMPFPSALAAARSWSRTGAARGQGQRIKLERVL
jgi:hypothetical protein